MRRALLLLILLLGACAATPVPQDTSIDQTPDWVRRNRPAATGAPPAPSTDAQPRPARGLRLLLQRTTASGAAVRRMGRANPWRITCRESIARNAIDCFARREAAVPGGREGIQVALFGSPGAAGAIFVLTDHDWPTDLRWPTVRVDRQPPVQIRGIVPFEPLLVAMLRGDVIHVSRFQWPSERRIEASIPLDGLQEGLENLVAAAERAGFRM